jgi:hypothetical protein
MRRSLYLLIPALLAVVACEGTPTNPREANAQTSTPAAPRATLSATSGGLATASIRAKVVGGLYVARGVTTGDAVHLQVRSVASTAGFSAIDSGTLVAEDTGTGSVEVTFSPSGIGKRYLVVAIPQESGVEYPARASFVEYVY